MKAEMTAQLVTDALVMAIWRRGKLLLVPQDRAGPLKGLPVPQCREGDIFDYIERFYNTTRRHSTIGYLSPVEFERRVGLT